MSAPAHIPRRDLHRGMTYGFYARSGYFSSPKAKEDVEKMAALGIEWVCVVATVLQETFASTRMYRDFKMTPADDELRDIIDLMHKKGMKVQLRPMLECWDGAQRMQIRFPHEQEIMPGKPMNHWTLWFDSMVERTLHYGSLATRAGCEAYGLDSELDYTVNQNAHWKRTVAAARSVFKGHLTTGHTGVVKFLDELKKPDHWFFDLDSLGTSFYTGVADKPGATADEMREKLKGPLAYFREVAAAYGKPFYFAECGCCSTAGATQSPAYWGHPGGYDGEEQARFLEAVLDTFWKEPWWMGIYWWKWDEQNIRPQFSDDPRGDKGFTLDGKPASQVMKRWYAKDR
jgi:hypothetical protein